MYVFSLSSLYSKAFFTDLTLKNSSINHIATRLARLLHGIPTTRHHWASAFSNSSVLGAATATETNTVVSTVAEEQSTSTEIRVLWTRCQSVSITGQGPCARVAILVELRYQLVACPSHLTMLSKIDVFYVFILSIPRHSPRRYLGLKLPNYGLGAPPTRGCLSSSIFPPPCCAVTNPRLPFLSLLSIMSDDLRY